MWGGGGLHPHCPLSAKAVTLPAVPFCRAHTDSDAAAEPGGAGHRHLRQVLDLRVRRHVHRGQLCWPPGGLQNRLHVPFPVVPHLVPGAHRDGQVGLVSGALSLTCPAHRLPPVGLLQPVEEAAPCLLVAGGSLYHAGAHRGVYLPVPGFPHLLAQPHRLHG